MTEEEFLSLPTTVALRILFDSLDDDTRAAVLSRDMPETPLPPKYDMAIYRRDGLQWASETDLDGLRFWYGKAVESAEKPGSKYAEKDRKKADNLMRWITWREVYPDATWSGERNRAPGVARGPSRKPKIYPTERSAARPVQQDPEIDPEADIPW